MNLDKKEPIHIRDFTAEEVGEIANYVRNSAPFTEKAIQQLYPLTENALMKAQTLCSSYRLLKASASFLEKDSLELKAKLDRIFDEYQEIYKKLYTILISLNKKFNYGKERKIREIEDIMQDEVYGEQINYFINIMLVFLEKQEFISLNKTTGLELDAPEGREAYKKMQESFVPASEEVDEDPLANSLTEDLEKEFGSLDEEQEEDEEKEREKEEENLSLLSSEEDEEEEDEEKISAEIKLLKEKISEEEIIPEEEKAIPETEIKLKDVIYGKEIKEDIPEEDETEEKDIDQDKFQEWLKEETEGIKKTEQ